MHQVAPRGNRGLPSAALELWVARLRQAEALSGPQGYVRERVTYLTRSGEGSQGAHVTISKKHFRQWFEEQVVRRVVPPPRGEFLIMSLRICSLGVLVGLVWAGVTWAQGGPAGSQFGKGQSDRVLATIGDKDYTLRDVRRMRSLIQPGLQAQTSQMTNRQFLGLMHNLIATAKAAESEGLLEREPYNAQWEFMRLQFLANAYANELGRTITVPDQELRDFYEQNKSRYESVSVSAIYLHYQPTAGAPSSSSPERPSEAQAKAKAEELLAAIQGGADFAELARKHSDDTASAKNGGVLGAFDMDSSIPEAIKAAILGLQAG